MAGDVKVAVISGQLSSSASGTADFTKSGFGTPKACMIIITADAVDNADVVAESRASVGFSDFSANFCISHEDEDASAKVDCDVIKSNTKAYILFAAGGPSLDIEGTASAITDGVRLTNSANVSGSTFFVTVVMFGGADLQVSLDSITLANTTPFETLVTTGIDQSLVFFIGADITAEDTVKTGVKNSFGVAHISPDHSVFTRQTMGWTSDHGATAGTPIAANTTDNGESIRTMDEGGFVAFAVALSGATSTSYTVTVTSPAGANMEIYALALDLDDRLSKVGDLVSPTSGATWTPSVSLGFTPQYVGLGLTNLTTEIASDASAGPMGISSNSGPGEETCHSWYNEDAAPDTVTNSLFRSRAIDFRNDDVVTVLQDHSHSSFNDGGWTYTINIENETVASNWFYWAIEEAAAGGPAADPLLGGLALMGIGR